MFKLIPFHLPYHSNFVFRYGKNAFNLLKKSEYIPCGALFLDYPS